MSDLAGSVNPLFLPLKLDLFMAFFRPSFPWGVYFPAVARKIVRVIHLFNKNYKGLGTTEKAVETQTDYNTVPVSPLIFDTRLGTYWIRSVLQSACVSSCFFSFSVVPNRFVKFFYLLRSIPAVECTTLPFPLVLFTVECYGGIRHQ